MLDDRIIPHFLTFLLLIFASAVYAEEPNLGHYGSGAPLRLKFGMAPVEIPYESVPLACTIENRNQIGASCKFPKIIDSCLNTFLYFPTWPDRDKILLSEVSSLLAIDNALENASAHPIIGKDLYKHVLTKYGTAVTATPTMYINLTANLYNIDAGYGRLYFCALFFNKDLAHIFIPKSSFRVGFDSIIKIIRDKNYKCKTHNVSYWKEYNRKKKFNVKKFFFGTDRCVDSPMQPDNEICFKHSYFEKHICFDHDNKLMIFYQDKIENNASFDSIDVDDWDKRWRYHIKEFVFYTDLHLCRIALDQYMVNLESYLPLIQRQEEQTWDAQAIKDSIKTDIEESKRKEEKNTLIIEEKLHSILDTFR